MNSTEKTTFSFNFVDLYTPFIIVIKTMFYH